MHTAQTSQKRTQRSLHRLQKSGILCLLALLTAVLSAVMPAGVQPIQAKTQGLPDWGPMDSGTLERLWGVWGSSSSDVFAVGDHGTILHYDGTAWSAMTSNTDKTLYDVWGTSGSNVYVAGGSDTIMHYDGANWTKTDGHCLGHCQAIWGSGASDIFVGSGAGRIMHYDGAAWTLVHESGTVAAIWGSGPNDVFAVGGDKIVHYDGVNWTEMAQPGTVELWDVWGSGGDNVYAVTGRPVLGGSLGEVLHYNGATWQKVHTAAAAFQGIWGSSATDLIVVGETPGTPLQRKNGTWSTMTGVGSANTSVWGSASDDVFATDQGGTIVHHPYPEAPDPFTDCNAIADVPVSECEALVAFWNDTNGPSWHWASKGFWLELDHACDWYGVDCANGHVTELDRDAILATGTLPEELGDLSYLQVLDVSSNAIGGGIPSTLGNLGMLERLILDGNPLGGNIPTTLGDLTNLEHLDLRTDELTGSIPPELGNLTKLTKLYLNVNQLTGGIPTSFGNLHALTQLYLNNNQLSGGIPTELGNLTMLEEMYLSSNPLGGGFPASLGNLGKLSYLSLWRNQLTGPLPADLGRMASLHYLMLSENQFSGALPPEIGKLKSLGYAYLQNNLLTGQLPDELGRLGIEVGGQLREFDVGENPDLSGPLPHDVINLLPVDQFDFANTQVCEPEHPSVQQWLQQAAVTSSGIVCPRPAGASLVTGKVVTDGSVRIPVADVLISDGGFYGASTDKWGQYALFVPAGNYDLTSSKLNYRFDPHPLAVTVPPDATEQNFVAIPLDLGFGTEALDGQALAPGSTVVVSGTGFLAGSQATISTNSDTVLGQVTADAQGELAFVLDTSQADPGAYWVWAKVNPEARFRFTLAADGALVEEEDAELDTFPVPAGIALHLIYLPVVLR